jgi:transcriptional regulator with XRE-family HTH domain
LKEKREFLMQLNLGDNIKKYRKEMKLTQEELAQAFGITVGAVSKWESGNTVPDILTLIELADFFNISVDVLLGYSISAKSIDDIIDRMHVLLKDNLHEEAISEADKALVRYPGNFKIIHACAKTYAVVCAASAYKKHLEKTIELYESALKHISQNDDPDIDEFSIRLDMAELKSAKDPEAALEDFRKINYMGIADANIATILMNEGRIDEAMEKYTRVLVSVLIKSLQFSSNMAIALAMKGKRSDFREACDVLDWGIAIFDATSNEKISYLTKVKVVLLTVKSMCLACLDDYDNMRLCIDSAYELALKFDKDPTNGLDGKIRFWHAESEYKPNLYDVLGREAVTSIDSIFAQDQELGDKVMKKIEKAREYWYSVKRS